MPIICNVSLLYLFLRLFFFAADSSFCFQCHSSLVHLNETHPVCRALKRSNLEIKKVVQQLLLYTCKKDNKNMYNVHNNNKEYRNHILQHIVCHSAYLEW